MRDYNKETISRVEFIKSKILEANAKGIVFGNSGGKDSALCGILASKACENVLGVIMPCESSLNYTSDLEDARKLASQFGIKEMIVDLTKTKQELVASIKEPLTKEASININPRLRMTTLYAIAQKNNYLVMGTGNRSEIYLGYFTKWGDGAYDFNPIADLTATEVFEYLRYLNAPSSIIEKKPSASLYEGQTDEGELGITYKELDDFLLFGKEPKKESLEIINKLHNRTEHKRKMPDAHK